MKEREIRISTKRGGIILSEVDDGADLILTIDGEGRAGVALDANQLHQLAVDILGWFGAIALNVDQQRAKSTELRVKIETVLEQNEARCLDDDIDRGVVVRELLKVLE